MPVNYNKPPPYERPNWERLNEGQRRYAMEQYNLALVRRGQYFEPPIAARPPSPAPNNAIQDLDELDRLLDNFPTGSPQQSQGGTSDVDQPVAGPSSRPDPVPIQLPVQPSTFQEPAQTMSTSEVTGVSQKRGAEPDSASTPTKKNKSSEHSGSALPGTSGNTDGSMASSSMQELEASRGIMPISRGIHVEKFEWTFTKKWKFLSFGVADVILTDDIGTTTAPAKRWALTTSLVNIPWEYAFMYMSIAEYTRLREMTGVFATDCDIRVFQYNPRVAFQTADTTSTQATLNQNKFTRVAKGLRNNPHLFGSDRDYVFAKDEPMKPEGFETNADQYTGQKFRDRLAKQMYGTTTISTNPPTVPAISTGKEMGLLRYYTVYASQTVDSGFPQYNKYCSEFNSMDLVGKQVLSAHHDFTYAPLTVRARNYQDSIYMPGDVPTPKEAQPASQYVNAGSKIVDLLSVRMPTTGFSAVGGNNSREEDSMYLGHLQIGGVALKTGEKLSDSSFQNFDTLYTKFPMEQGGIYNEAGYQGATCGDQESLHVGVRAVPKLGTAVNNIEASSWLDCQMYWTVECRLRCVSTEPFTYPRGNVSDIPLRSQFTGANSNTPFLQTFDRPYFYGKPQRVDNTVAL